MGNDSQKLERDKPYYCNEADVYDAEDFKNRVFEEIGVKSIESVKTPRILYPDSLSSKDFGKIIRFNLRKFEKRWSSLDKKSLEEFTKLFLQDAKINI